MKERRKGRTNKQYNWQPPHFGEKRENEITCYTVAVGNLPMPPFIKKETRQAIEFINELPGFVGFYPHWPNGTLCVFRTKNDAIRGKNEMQGKGIQTGINICEIYVEKQYVKDYGEGNE